MKNKLESKTMNILQEYKDSQDNFANVVSSSDELYKFLKKINPYPKDIFTEPTQKDYKTMNKALKQYGLKPDCFFGSWGRTVWNNCAKEIKEIIDDES